jgi:BirA family biotin operon repressor/biotin-[acetyl-CoA-carboxylase] ligase
VVVAEHQTAGRGRAGRTWEAPPRTALLASFVLPFSPLASLAAGVAVAETCGPDARLKWPNDVLLGGGKLAGILVEAHGEVAIVGVGINLTWAPEGGALLGADRDELLPRLHQSLIRWLDALPEQVLEGWRARTATLGRRVRVVLPDQTYEGQAQDIDEHGALIVDGTVVSAGSLIHL